MRPSVFVIRHSRHEVGTKYAFAYAEGMSLKQSNEGGGITDVRFASGENRRRHAF
jgi:hypothetical protein